MITTALSDTSVRVVTSPHRVRDAPDEPWRPFGRHHALVPGSRLTVCGIDVQTWRVFDHLPFEVDQPEACLGCGAARSR